MWEIRQDPNNILFYSISHFEINAVAIIWRNESLVSCKKNADIKKNVCVYVLLWKCFYYYLGTNK